MKAKINEFEVEGTVDEIYQLVHKNLTDIIHKETVKRQYVKSGKFKKKKYRKQLNRKSYNNKIKTIALRRLRTKEPLGLIIKRVLKRQAGGTDYINAKKEMRKLV